MSQVTCDPGLLSDFLSNQLTADAESQVVEHLDTCVHCRQFLEQLAGGQRWWREAQVYLSSEQEDVGASTSIGPRADADDDDCDDEITAMPIRLDFLAPTDDPRSLGRMGTYEVVGVVGRGGTGIVLKAFDGTLNRLIAIKVLSPNLATSAAARRRFARESRAAAAVVHEHIVPIHAVSEQQALPYIVMQYVPGRSLQQRLDQQGPLPLHEILRIGLQTAAGLAAAHAQGLVHRDVKPANILLENGIERVLLTDFGLARTIDEASLTCSGVIAGTPQYMAPEQARGELVDYRSDLFSLGSVLYALCTGHSPFRAETTMGVLHRICKESPRPIQELNSEIPLWLSAIITRLHAKNPAKRYASAAEVAEILQRQLARLQSPSGTPGLSWAEAALSARAWLVQHARRIGLWAGGAAALLVVSAVVLEKFWPRADIRQQAADPSRAAVSSTAGTSTIEDPQSDKAWRQSLSELNARIESVESEFHAAPQSPDRIVSELATLRDRLDALNVPDDTRRETEAH